MIATALAEFTIGFAFIAGAILGSAATLTLTRTLVRYLDHRNQGDSHAR